MYLSSGLFYTEHFLVIPSASKESSMDASLSMTRVGEDSEHSFVSFRLPARNDTSVFIV
jgi:hypothetical protein